MSIKNIVFAAVEMDIVKHHAENSLGRNKMTNYVALVDWASNKFGEKVSTMTILGY
jgi:hypothetical protein